MEAEHTTGGGLEFGVLGPLRVQSPRGPVDVVGARRRRLLAALIADRNRVVSVDRLVDAVFVGEPPPGAATTIRSYVARLRRSLANGEHGGQPLIATEASGYLLPVSNDQVDADRFVAKAQLGNRQLHDGDAVAAVSSLRDALDLWRGNAYQEFLYEDWARGESSQLEEHRALAEGDLIDGLLRCGLTDEAVPRLRRLIDHDPLRDRFRTQFALALYREGRQAEALRSLAEYRKALGDIGLEPPAELTTLQASIAAHDPALRPPVPAGRQLRGYRLGEALGKGCHGVVFRAIQPGTGRTVAVKAIGPELSDQPDFIRRFDAQVQLVSRLEHPHIVTLYDYWREPGGAYLVMRLVPSDLSERLDAGPMSVEEVATLAEQVGTALAAAHSEGVTHGHVAPSNVLVNQSDYYVTDLGIGSLVASLPIHDTEEESEGYEPPERRAGGGPELAGDQYSLAVLLAHALSGILPFGRRGMAAPTDQTPSIHLHRPNVPAAVDEVLRTATAWKPEDRYPDIGSFIDEFLAALDGRARSPRAKKPTANPYRALKAFTESDRHLFFGREALVHEVLSRLEDVGPTSRFVALVGASGSGKSSIMRAGVVPRLRAGGVSGSEQWFIATMVPGSRPFTELETALRAIATDAPRLAAPVPDVLSVGGIMEATVPKDRAVLLVIDQAEELFTVVSDQSTRRAFLDGIAEAVSAADSNLRVALTLRADCYDRPLRYHRFGELVKQGTVTVVGMTAADLDAAVTQPAAQVGCEVEPALASQIVAEVVDQPAALPLLQFTMTELFEHRKGAVLTLDSYRQLGGVETTVARRADQVFHDLSEEDQVLARRMFLRLLTVDETGKAVRRRVLRSELSSLAVDPAELDRIIDLFGDARLLTFDHDPSSRGPTVEVAHEALIRHWPLLSAWVSEAGAGLRIRSHLTEAAAAWESQGRDPSDLYRGLRLDSALEWAAEQPEAVSNLEHNFLVAGAELHDAEESERRQRLEQQRTANRRLRLLLGGVGMALALGLVAGFVALSQWRTAQRETRQEEARRLAASSELSLQADPELSILLALEAADVSLRAGEPPRPEAVAALHNAVQTSRLEHHLEGANRAVDVSPDGSAIATGAVDNINDVVIWDAVTGDRLRTLPGDLPLFGVTFSPDGRLLAVGYASESGEAEIVLQDASTGVERGRVPGGVGGVWSPAGDMFASVSWSGGEVTVTTWDVSEPDESTQLSSITVEEFGGLMFLDDTILAAGDLVIEDVGFYDILTGERVDHLATPGFAPDRLRIDHGHERLIASSFESGEVRAWDLTTRSPIWTRPRPGVVALDIDIDTGRVATSGLDGLIELWDGNDGSLLDVLAGHTGPAWDVVFFGEGRRLASYDDVEARIWDTTRAGPTSAGTVDIGAESPFDVVLSADGREAVVQTTGELLHLDLVTGEQQGDPMRGWIDWDVPAAALPDRDMVAVLDPEGRGSIRRLSTGEGVSELPPCTIAKGFSPDGTALVLDGVYLARAGECGMDLAAAAGRRSRVVEAATGRVLLDLGEREVGGPVFSPASGTQVGRYFAVIIEDDLVVEVYDMETWDRVTTTAGFASNDPLVVAFDPTGRYLAAGTQLGRAWVLDLTAVVDGSAASEALAFDQAVDTGGVADVALNAEGVLATSAFGSLRLWDIHSGQQVNTVDVDTEVPPVASFSPEGGDLFYADRNGGTGYVLRRFPLDPERLIALAQSRVGRGLTKEECRQHNPASCD